MNITFENIVVNADRFINTFFYSFLELALIITLVLAALLFLIYKFSSSVFFKIFVTNVSLIFFKTIIIIFKLTLSIIIFKYVFFYNFETHIYVYEFPKQMLLSSLFVGMLAFYEIVGCIFDIVELAKSLCLTLVSKD